MIKQRGGNNAIRVQTFGLGSSEPVILILEPKIVAASVFFNHGYDYVVDGRPPPSSCSRLKLPALSFLNQMPGQG